jgi:DNA polymerase (family 10)
MDSRSAGQVLSQIAAFLELAGENRYKARAYQLAARRLMALGADDLAPLLRSGELSQMPGLGPATLGVVRDLVETGESQVLERLRASTPEGLLELMRVPGLSLEKIHKLHADLGIESLADLEQAAQDGRLRKAKGWGARTTEKLLASIAFMKDASVLRLYVHAIAEAQALLASIRAHPDVDAAEIAGSLRRQREVIGDVDIVASCRASPVAVAQSFTRVPGVRSATGAGATVTIRYVDGAKLDLQCVEPDDFAAAWWRATGTEEHVAAVRGRMRADQRAVDEAGIYADAGLPWIPPELREGLGEVEAAARGSLPHLIEPADIRGVLHCHTQYSDGKATIAEMAAAAQARGWSYLGVSDHSQAAFYASGVAREQMLEQHDEIDELNGSLSGFRILKGVEADILADGRLDYDAELLDRFDYVIGSIHSRFKMDGAAMTERVLRAMDDPHMTILAHPTGRLLLARDAYAIDLDAVFQKAVEAGVAVELNADPHRLDLDWRHVHRARALGAVVEIGPDAHSAGALGWTDLGVAMARKGWLGPADVLNARSADGVLDFARRRRAR